MDSYDSLYEFTKPGMEMYRKVMLGEIPEGALDLSDSHYVSNVAETGRFSPAEYETTKEMAEAILGSIGDRELFVLLPLEGLWAWLTFIFRDALFKCDAEGKRKLGEIYRWDPSDPNDWQKSQRHLVRMPVQLLDFLGDDADHLLCGHPSILPEIREQLTSQQDMFSKTFQHVARSLYFDDANRKLKRGAGGKGPGSPRRLARVRQQLNVTWELEDLNHERIIGMLPDEFERFKPSKHATK